MHKIGYEIYNLDIYILTYIFTSNVSIYILINIHKYYLYNIIGKLIIYIIYFVININNHLSNRYII